MPMMEGAGVELHYEVRGEGSPVFLVHGLAADAAAFAPLVAGLADRATTIAFDRRGYGSSGAPEPYTATTVAEQAQDAAALLAGLGLAGVTAVGEGFGALVVLDLIKRHAALVGAAVVADPPLYAFVPEATEIMSEERARLERSLRHAGPAAAVEDWLAGRAGAERLGRAREAHRGFLADYAGLASWPVTRAELRGLAPPIVVLTGPDTPAHVAAAADALARLVPGGRRRYDGDLLGAVSELLP
ncbi:MAG: alpha/beta fold hydrolase [Solirubrobacteraceae bacterium]